MRQGTNISARRPPLFGVIRKCTGQRFGLPIQQTQLIAGPRRDLFKSTLQMRGPLEWPPH